MARFFGAPTEAETRAARQVAEAALDRHLETHVKRQKRLGLWAALFIGISAIAVVIALLVINTRAYSRPPDVAITDSQELESLPSLIKAVTVDSEVFAIEFTESLEDPSNLFYYVNLHGDATGIEDELGIENPTLHLIPDLVSMESSLRIGPINDVEFPYRLPDSFLPGNFEGIVLVAEDDGMDGDNVFVASFVVVDETRNIGIPIPAPISIPQSASTPPPVQAPVNPPPVNTPAALPPPPPQPTVLVANLEGRSRNYNIDGSTITIDSVRGFEGGQVVNVPRLQFNVNAASAPAPYLYLSKRSFAETQRGNLDADDILIEIDGIRDGTFTKGGSFEQLLDEIDNTQDLSEFNGGSFIVWCRPFEIYLGGGPIQARRN